MRIESLYIDMNYKSYTYLVDRVPKQKAVRFLIPVDTLGIIIKDTYFRIISSQTNITVQKHRKCHTVCLQILVLRNILRWQPFLVSPPQPFAVSQAVHGLQGGPGARQWEVHVHLTLPLAPTAHQHWPARDKNSVNVMFIPFSSIQYRNVAIFENIVLVWTLFQIAVSILQIYKLVKISKWPVFILQM